MMYPSFTGRHTFPRKGYFPIFSRGLAFDQLHLLTKTPKWHASTARDEQISEEHTKLQVPSVRDYWPPLPILPQDDAQAGPLFG